ncbi:MAG: aspartyl-phosphate phosphatase Spo0E family protein [Clostridium sp.]|nr:aspartyl-phosphate phosphatase Spo0E family protein [Clostridium sp.]
MDNIYGKADEIDILRDKLNNLINEKNGNLLDPQVVIASKILNAAINKSNSLKENEKII